MMTTPTAIAGHRHDGSVISKRHLWAGRIISGFGALFFLWDGVMKLMKPAVVVKATRDLGYPESEIAGIGVVLLVCTLLYIFPRTSILGAILLTGYLGGAIASQVRVEASWFNVVFAFVFACLVWGGLWLRDVRVREFLMKS
jgi:arginine exporter protein ArgO